jgi:hypothetical protein
VSLLPNHQLYLFNARIIPSSQAEVKAKEEAENEKMKEGRDIRVKGRPCQYLVVSNPQQKSETSFLYERVHLSF